MTTPQPSYFTPADQYWRGCANPFNDWDFGSGGTLAIPESTFTPPQFFAVKLDKGNYLWVMDRTNPGGYTGGQPGMYCGANQSCQQNQQCMNANNNQESFHFTTALNCKDKNNQPIACEDRSTPAFWSGTVSSNDQGELYLAGTYDQMMRFPVSASCNPICTTPGAISNVDPAAFKFGYSATPSISSNGTTLNTGVVWAIKNNYPANGILYALKADDLTERYNTGTCKIGQNLVDQPGVATTFSVPTIANGYVYIGTETDFDIYGPLTRTCTP